MTEPTYIFSDGVHRDIIFFLSRASESSEVSMPTFSEICAELPNHGKTAIFYALIQLNLDGLINSQKLTNSPAPFTQNLLNDEQFSFLSPTGMNYLRTLLPAKEPADQAMPADESPIIDAAAPGDFWEPIPLDRESPGLAEAIKSLDKARDAIAADNGYAANEADERSAVLSALETGSAALKTQAVIYRIQFKAMIWEPLARAGKKFGSSAVGVIVSAAKDALKEYFKEFFKGGLN